MLYLILCILCCTSLLLFFKWFEKYEVNFLQGIVFNYLTCAIIGAFLTDFSSVSISFNNPWFLYAILLGSLFIGIFFLSGLTTKHLGISVGTISMKLGVVFPILIGLFIYHEHFTFYTISGIITALLAVVFSTVKFQKIQSQPKNVYLLPFVVWIGSGLCDSMVQYVSQKFFRSSAGFEAFVLIVFFFAFTLGGLAVVYQRQKITLKNIVGGCLLGIPNYGSMYFLFKAIDDLQSNHQMASSVIFTLNNIAIVLLSSVIAIALFNEKLNRLNWIGLALAVISIWLISK